MRIHLGTDLGGDPDDACALAMLLGWPGVELVGITTTIDPGGRRAGCVAHCLKLAGRDDIPVAAGAGVSLTTLRRADPTQHRRRALLAEHPRCPAVAAGRRAGPARPQHPAGRDHRRYRPVHQPRSA
jgi:inosine-uridine nucleoside N-ribohydrolase